MAITEGKAIDQKPILPKPKFKLYPKQQFALHRPEYEILYGGARGGAKTIGGIAWIAAPRDYSQYRGLVIRKNADDLKDWVDRAKIIFKPYGALKVGSPPEFRWPSGAKIRTGHLKDEDAYEKYQGHEYQRMLIEELTQIPTEISYLKLMSSCRSTIDGLPAQAFITTNPGGIGHQWVRSRFIDCAPSQTTYYDPISGRSRIFIPATIDDNPVLMEKDPDYVKFLDSLPPGLKEAWRYGSWDYVVGAAFSELTRDIHGIDVSNPPERLLRVFDFDIMVPLPGINVYRTYDWGYDKPASVGYWLSDYDNRLYRWNEIYFHKGDNIGSHTTTRDQARKIKEFEREKDIKPVLRIADASIWDKPTNSKGKGEVLPSDAEIMAQEGVHFDEFISKEIKKPHSRIGGVSQMHDRLRIDDDGLPNIFFFSTCREFWRTVPVLPTDPLNPEDVDSEAEDHIWDDTKMALLARPFKSRTPQPKRSPMSLDSIWEKYGGVRIG